MSDTQTLTMKGFLIFVVLVWSVYFLVYGLSHILTKHKANKYAKEHFRKIEEYRNELD